MPAAAYLRCRLCRCPLQVGGENFIDMARWAGVQ